ncbi:hypothetical protein ACVGVM_15905 [Pseudonocardia bannensis]|uniref:Uncharacterized protein n=1 Tax=Pseudonocardia bannensis TaxID=630973 RepID=A0A848DEI5_9PSEU|nr:hypothetical protein [Pseudonocardia bannensis]NMH90997.1 hypothetical protein [Pseudonocardia bannensis]
MTIAGGLELVAWILSAIIAGWLVFDVVRVARTHDEHLLINAAELIDTPAEPRAGARDAEGGRA